MSEHLAWLIPLLPLLSVAWIVLLSISGAATGDADENRVARIAQGSMLLSLLLSLAFAVQAMVSGAPGHIVTADWFHSGDIQIRLSLLLDATGIALMTLVALIAFLVTRFSVQYMHREAGFRRFFFGLSLFSASMLLVVMAGNLVLMFIGWELAGLSSWLLIAYAFDRKVASSNASRAVVTNRIGDAGFILGMYLCLVWLGGVEWIDIQHEGPALTPFHAGLLVMGFIAAAMTKSAQFPFSAWITRALEGPTPSSAIFYGSLMVHCGVYLLIRLEPVLQGSLVFMDLLIVVGLLSVLYGWLCGLVQTDVKSGLIFSVIAQVGLMFIWCGLGWFEFATWHLALHAMWRIYQFLHAPAMMQLVSRAARPAPRWLTRSRHLHTMALQRFWLDPVAEWLLIRPSRTLARDLNTFDEQVVTRVVGLPEQATAISSLREWELQKQAGESKEGVVRGHGLLGRMLEGLANMLYWFEERLVLRGGGAGLISLLHRVGAYLARVDYLLSQPRYLLVLVILTFVVIL